ncbi:MAG: hypothetical protein PVH87_19615 [Desulfobacteraceae bacterium]
MFWSLVDHPLWERIPTSTLLFVEDDHRDALLIMGQLKSEPSIIKWVCISSGDKG